MLKTNFFKINDNETEKVYIEYTTNSNFSDIIKLDLNFKKTYGYISNEIYINKNNLYI